MIPAETARLCRIVMAVSPSQRFDEFTPDAWHAVIGDLPMDDCTEAVRRIARRQVYVAPADIVGEVMRLRAERAADVPAGSVPDADPDDPLAYQQALREQRFRPPPVDVLAAPGRVRAAIAGVFRRPEEAGRG